MATSRIKDVTILTTLLIFYYRVFDQQDEVCTKFTRRKLLQRFGITILLYCVLN